MPEQQEQQAAAKSPKWKALLTLRWVGGLRSRYSGRQLAIPIVSLALIAGGGVGYVVFFGEEDFDPQKLERANEALRSGDLADARSLATELYSLPSLTIEQRTDVAFVLGASLAHSAEDNSEESRREFAELAIPYLREAADAGVSAEQETELWFQLGRSYLYADEAERAIETLDLIADREDAPQPAVHQLLADAWMHQTRPNPTAALASNDRALGVVTDEETRDTCLLQRAEILLRLGRIAEARAAIAPLTSRSDPTPAQFLLAQASLAAGQRLRQSELPGDQAQAVVEFREALRLFEIAEGRDTIRRRRISGCNYFRAMCLLELQEPDYALVELDEIQRLEPRSAEAVAAAFLHAEVLQAQGRPQQSVDKWIAALALANATQPFRNPWLTQAEITNRLQIAVRGFWSKGAFEEASLLLRSDLYFLTREDSERLLAQTYEQSARALTKLATGQDKEAAAKSDLKSRLEYQRAGHVLSRLAQLHAATRQYPDDLWASAQAYLAAEDPRNAIRVLDQYVLHDTTNVRTAEALYFLAKSYQQLGNAEKAKRIADECVERYPKNPIRYQARLISSQARIELDDLEEAEEPLIENLDNDLLTPASMEWRLSLFELSKLLYLEQKWDEAERRLTEAVRRYPEDRLSLEGRYLLAETLRQQAERDRNRSATTAVESLRVGAARSALARLRDAHARTEEALAGLQQLSREVELTPMDLALQRNAAFLRANLLAELARYDEASKAFMEFINRYYGRPETLDAYLALATVFRRMDQEGEARTAVAQAYETLQSLPPDAVMAHTSAGSIADWQNLLTWLQSL